VFIVIQQTPEHKPFFVTQKIGYTVCMEQPKRPRGRPPKPPEELLEQRSIRLTPAQWAKVDEFGMEWLRKLIQRAKGQK
jgi:hypothetical protein